MGNFGVLVTKVDFDNDVDVCCGDSPIIEEMMAVFVTDEIYTADEKAKDYIEYVSDNTDFYDIEGDKYPQYDIRHIRVY